MKLTLANNCKINFIVVVSAVSYHDETSQLLALTKSYSL